MDNFVKKPKETIPIVNVESDYEDADLDLFNENPETSRRIWFYVQLNQMNFV